MPSLGVTTTWTENTFEQSTSTAWSEDGQQPSTSWTEQAIAPSTDFREIITDYDNYEDGNPSWDLMNIEWEE